MTLLHLSQLLDRAEEAKLTEKKYEFAKNAEKLSALNPLAVLARGYGAVENEDGRIVLGARDLEKNMNIKIRFADGEAKATVSEVYTNE